MSVQCREPGCDRPPEADPRYYIYCRLHRIEHTLRDEEANLEFEEGLVARRRANVERLRVELAAARGEG